MALAPDFHFDNSFADRMQGFFVPWNGDMVPEPSVLRLNSELAIELGLDPKLLNSPQGAAILTGAQIAEGSVPLAMAYAGHQFGGFSPQLGDGRAILLGELLDNREKRFDLHLKGSGRTPFSRGGDGKAVLGPVLREYLMGEAMHALGVPTTRALAAVTTGEQIHREGLQQGAVLARIASSHLRVGTFQFFAAKGETDMIKRLVDFAIARHCPDIVTVDAPYLEFFRHVRDAQAHLVAQWMNIGFVHGVMNTDNVTISGETIDYGPCAFIDAYDPYSVFSSIDRQGRYAYGNQPAIMQWNLARFAETLLNLINPDDPEDAARQMTEEVNLFEAKYQAAWLGGMRAKLGLATEQTDDLKLANDLLKLAEANKVDFTKLFRSLSSLVRGDAETIRKLFEQKTEFDDWVQKYQNRLDSETGSIDQRADQMDQVNPIYIPRNHLVEDALQAATDGNMEPFDALLEKLKNPFTAQQGAERFGEPAPESFGEYRTFCGT